MDKYWTLGRVAEAVGGRLVGDDVAVTGAVVTDSREAGEGALYVARVGETTDGHLFLADVRSRGGVGAIVTDRAQAEAAGIPAVVVDDATVALGDLARAHLRRLREAGCVRVIAITGSAGKTTTKDLLAQVCSRMGPTVAPRLSFNNEVGLPLTVLTADASTQYLVLEAGASGPGHLAYLTSIAPPDIAVELLVGQAHLGGFGSIEALANAKAELVDGLARGGIAVLNADDARVAAMAERAERVVTFGRDPSATVRAEDLTVAGLRPHFTLVWPGGEARVSSPLVGAHHVTNILAAAAVALTLGCDGEDVARALSEAGALSPHRMAISELPGDVVLIDDSYNANPDSLRAGLDALAAIAAERSGRTLAVIGQMLELGDDAPALHAACGTYAASVGLDYTISLGGLADEFARAAGAHESVTGYREAAERVLAIAQPGDTVLVKGSNSSNAHRVATAVVSPEGERP